MASEAFTQYIRPTYFIDSDAPSIIAFVRDNSDEHEAPEKRILNLYYRIRDGFLYDPYSVDLRPQSMKASFLLSKKGGYCIEKANLLAACGRVLGIPTRLGFANVRNHIGTDKLQEALRSDLLVFHGYTELWMHKKWVKATPAFNIELCRRLGVAPLDFDGREDSIFQEYDHRGGQYMEYVHDYGQFADLPRELFIRELKKYYSHLFENTEQAAIFSGIRKNPS